MKFLLPSLTHPNEHQFIPKRPRKIVGTLRKTKSPCIHAVYEQNSRIHCLMEFIHLVFLLWTRKCLGHPNHPGDPFKRAPKRPGPKNVLINFPFMQNVLSCMYISVIFKQVKCKAYNTYFSTPWRQWPEAGGTRV